MKIGVPKETVPGETRVSLVPETVSRLTKAGSEVLVESGAGEAAFFSDQQYQDAGATIVRNAQDLYQQADLVPKIQRPTDEEIKLMRSGLTFTALLQPLTNIKLVQSLAENGVTSFSMDAIPRIARAQRMDVLSSQSSVAGYKAAIVAADTLGKHLPMMMTAAGTMPPAKGLVLGAGVAGLQAIATGRRLGAVMSAFDVRPAVKEQVESLGATFVEDEEIVSESAETAGGYAREQSQDEQARTQALVHRNVRDSDFVITTALIPGRPAPKLITDEMVADMRPGSVIIDLAAETGGNCTLTKPGETIVHQGVIIHGPLNLPATMPIHASQMYSRNVASLLELLIKDDALNLDLEDVIIKDALITHEGRIVHEATLAATGAS